VGAYKRASQLRRETLANPRACRYSLYNGNRKFPFSVNSEFVIPGNFLDHPVPSVPKFPNAPMDTNPWGWYPDVSTLRKGVGTKDVGAFGVEVGGFMQLDGEVVAKVFPDFEVPEAGTATGYCPVFTGSIHAQSNLLLMSLQTPVRGI
jgi:hypothetical protein